MNYTYTQHKNLACLCFNGDITMEAALPLRRQKNAPWLVGQHNLLVDLAQVGFLDSCAVGLLVDMFHNQRRQGLYFGFMGLQPQAEAVLDLVGLLPHVPTFDTPAQALDSWGQTP
jgi:anti-anti-sigma factor